MRLLTPSRLVAVLAVTLAAISMGVAAARSGSSGGAQSAGKHRWHAFNHRGHSRCPGKRGLRRNKRNVVRYYTLAFNDKQPELAVERYGGPFYIQHNPLAANGFEAFIGFVQFVNATYPNFHVDIRRVIAECNLVVTHAVQTGEEEFVGPFGTKAVDIFRLNRRGKVIEHWDVLAPISDPATNQNGNPEV